MECCCCMLAIGLFLLYKIVEYLIRLPSIGHYNERYILVTGCDSGFGLEIAKRLDTLGCHVFAGCITEIGRTQLKKSSSNRLHTISLDITSDVSIWKAFNDIISVLPQRKGNYLSNNVWTSSLTFSHKNYWN